MNIGHIQAGKGASDAKGAAGSSRPDSLAESKKTKLARADHAVISGPARERHLEVSRLQGQLDSIDAGKSESELDALRRRLDAGAFDHEVALRETAERIVRE